MWLTFLTRLPLVIGGIMQIVEHVKGASGPEKKAAVLRAIPESVALAEVLTNRDLLNDAAVQDAISAYIDAEHQVRKLRAALLAVLHARRPPEA